MSLDLHSDTPFVDTWNLKKTAPFVKVKDTEKFEKYLFFVDYCELTGDEFEIMI